MNSRSTPADVIESTESPDYLSKQLITYLGNKRALLGTIEQAVNHVRNRLGGRKLISFDAFTGSGVVARLLKQHSQKLIVNDLEDYAAVIARCFLSNRSEVDLQSLTDQIEAIEQRLETTSWPIGFIEQLYAPRDERAITPEDRVFYTRENAIRLDNYRRALDQCDPRSRDLLLGPLLSRASIHANTAGVFKGFYKDRKTGVGTFGGSGGDALSRIRGRIILETPVLSRFECDVVVLQQDANDAARQIGSVDLCYLDPPYNQHPYGSNYFMLNLLVGYQPPEQISRVSGIPTNWKRSQYNVRRQALPALQDLLRKIDAKFLLISFNDEGFVSPAEMRAMLQPLGRLQVFETVYNAFRGSRNFDRRSIHVTEQLFLVERR